MAICGEASWLDFARFKDSLEIISLTLAKEDNYELNEVSVTEGCS